MIFSSEPDIHMTILLENAAAEILILHFFTTKGQICHSGSFTGAIQYFLLLSTHSTKQSNLTMCFAF